MDPNVNADWIGHSHCGPAAARSLQDVFGESQDIMASSVPLPDLEKTPRNAHESKQHGSHLFAIQ